MRVHAYTQTHELDASPEVVIERFIFDSRDGADEVEVRRGGTGFTVHACSHQKILGPSQQLLCGGVET